MKTIPILASTLALAATPAMAGTTMPHTGDPQAIITSTESEWRASTSMYGWFTRLDGDMAINGTTIPVDVPFEDVFDNLKFTFMGLVEVGKGRWSFMTDLFYAKLEPSVSTQLFDFDSQIEQFIGNFAVFYRVAETSSTHLDTYAGVRVNWMETDVSIVGKGPFGVTVNESADKTWVDPIIGLRVHHDLNEKFYVRGLADIGGFSISSDITWQAMVTLGYRVTDQTSIGLGYRGLGTDYASGSTTYDVISHGFLLGLSHTF
jgi:opacity protein-like surface antigen